MLPHKTLMDELHRLSLVVTTSVHICGDSNFSDNSSALEELVRFVYLHLDHYALVNTNSIQRNYPAIDLVDDANKIAIQVTATASSKKIKHTVDQWKKLGKQGHRLIIVGITKKTKSKLVSVTSLSELVGRAATLKLAELQQLVIGFRDRISPASYSLTTDKACISTLRDYMDRGALRHLHNAEGDYERMYKSLETLRHYLLTGNDNEYPVRIKPLSMFEGTTKTTLREIEHLISDIMSICDRHRNVGGGLFLSDQQYREIDGLKMKIATLIGTL